MKWYGWRYVHVWWVLLLLFAWRFLLFAWMLRDSVQDKQWRSFRVMVINLGKCFCLCVTLDCWGGMFKISMKYVLFQKECKILTRLCLFFSRPSELCSLHHWRWKRYFNWRLKIPGQGLCRYVSLTSGIIVNIWCSPLIFCVHVCVNVLTSSHYSMSVPRVPASGTSTTEGKLNCQSKDK